MQFSVEQFAQISAAHHQGRLGELQHRVSQGLPRGRQADPAARLQRLADEVLALAQPPALGRLVAVDVQQAVAWLQLGLTQGAAYREARCAALLHAAASLGALWFVDDRLLAQDQQLPLSSSLSESMARLVGDAQGARFKRAADTHRLRRPGLQLALARVLDDGATPETTRALVAAAFQRHEAPADPEDEPADTGEAAAIQRFLAHEGRLLQQAGVAEGALHTLCLCGDLAFGLGRCARLLASQAERHDEPARLAWLQGALHGLAGRSQ